MDSLHTNSAESRTAGRSTLLSSKKAFSLVEILIAMVVFSIFTTGIVYLSISTLERDDKAVVKNESLLYTQECLEAVRNIKDRDYLDLVSGQYGLSFTSDTWSFIAAPELIDDFYSRTVTIEDVYRDVDGNIADTGTLDPETKYVTCDVTWDWKGVFPQTETLSAYMTNWRGYNWEQTLCSEFTGGSFSSTETVETPIPPEDNCAVALEFTESMSEFFSSADTGEHGVDVSAENGYAYLATSKTNQGFAVVDIAIPASPVVENKLDIGGKGRYVVNSGNYAYVGVENSSGGLVTVNITDPTNPSVAKTTNFSAMGNQPFLAGSYLYMGLEVTTNSFRVFSISTPSNPTQVAYLNFDANTNVVHVDGNYAYVGTDKSGGQLKVVDITTPASPSLVASLDVGGEINAIEIYGTVAYVGVSGSSAIQVVNISNPLSPSIAYTLTTSGKVQDMVYNEDYLYAAIDETSSGLNIINISNPFVPYLASVNDITGKGTGACVNEGYVFITIDINNSGLVVKEALVPGYPTSGTYISDAFDTGSEQIRYNFIDWDYTDTVGGTIKLQIRTADTEAHLSSATWVGSDGTASTYYENPRTTIVTSPSATGKRFIQFQIIMTSDTFETPLVDSVNINYNP